MMEDGEDDWRTRLNRFVCQMIFNGAAAYKQTLGLGLS
jgi:hypothetical protein